jgi:hypothetical protein
MKKPKKITEPAPKGTRWVSIELPESLAAVLIKAAEQDNRNLKDYLKRILAAHAVMWETATPISRALFPLFAEFEPKEQRDFFSHLWQSFAAKAAASGSTANSFDKEEVLNAVIEGVLRRNNISPEDRPRVITFLREGLRQEGQREAPQKEDVTRETKP